MRAPRPASRPSARIGSGVITEVERVDARRTFVVGGATGLQSPAGRGGFMTLTHLQQL
jgi:hypothetical protein